MLLLVVIGGGEFIIYDETPRRLKVVGVAKTRALSGKISAANPRFETNVEIGKWWPIGILDQDPDLLEAVLSIKDEATVDRSMLDAIYDGPTSQNINTIKQVWAATTGAPGAPVPLVPPPLTSHISLPPGSVFGTPLQNPPSRGGPNEAYVYDMRNPINAGGRNQYSI